MRKRKVNYPVARTATRQVRTVGLPGDPDYVRSTVADINLAALAGRDDIRVGDRVRIGGGGLYAGELAVVESIVGGLIPAAIVRTEAGKTRRVRAVDLERVAVTAAATAAPKIPEQTVEQAPQQAPEQAG